MRAAAHGDSRSSSASPNGSGPWPRPSCSASSRARRSFSASGPCAASSTSHTSDCCCGRAKTQLCWRPTPPGWPVCVSRRRVSHLHVSFESWEHQHRSRRAASKTPLAG